MSHAELHLSVCEVGRAGLEIGSHQCMEFKANEITRDWVLVEERSSLKTQPFNLAVFQDLHKLQVERKQIVSDVGEAQFSEGCTVSLYFEEVGGLHFVFGMSPPFQWLPIFSVVYQNLIPLVFLISDNNYSSSQSLLKV